ncbi:epimerase family protein [Kordia sp. SMS9]|uniref:TIGR01777 family oxidoreductase n=1 Tax=Kordia sp. SMS9 TaxID=2282170 RepID=UPI000E0D4E56|nr:TIGR01777 family oxidoreductase [Kordia sp. SMS9]AXG67953.1 epimerase family protein [Kordia sp. SMS9]
MKKIIIAGGSGFLGQSLISYFLPKGYEIIVLSRSARKTGNDHLRYVQWNAKTLDIWMTELEGATVLINLTGKSVDCRYSEKNKAEILNSRVNATKVLGEAIQACAVPPKVWMNSSTATIYEHSLKRKMTEENGKIGDDFSMNVAKSWEATFYDCNTPKTNKIALRTSIVLGKNGGAFIPLKNLTKLGLGGTQGSGKQKVSWIHEHDFCRAVAFLLEKHETGTYNITAPNPIENKRFMKTIRNVLKVPFGLFQPKWLLKFGALIIKTEAELILKSRFVIPEKLVNAGFQFQYPTAEKAIEEIINRH